MEITIAPLTAEGDEPMSDEDRTLLRIAVEELARRREERRSRETPGEGGRKRMFMAGRVGPDASRVHYAESARPPVDGPWDLALVVRPR